MLSCRSCRSVVVGNSKFQVNAGVAFNSNFDIFPPGICAHANAMRRLFLQPCEESYAIQNEIQALGMLACSLHLTPHIKFRSR
jgi:hypothetical protein